MRQRKSSYGLQTVSMEEFKGLLQLKLLLKEWIGTESHVGSFRPIEELDQLGPEAEFVADLGFDSLDLVEFLLAIEDGWGCTIPDWVDVENTLGGFAAKLALFVQSADSN